MSEDTEHIPLEKGFKQINDNGIRPFIKMIETESNNFFRAKEFVELYDHIFKMCIQRDPYNWSEELYRRYSDSIKNYLRENVKPALEKSRTRYERAYLEQWKTRYANHGRIVFGLSKLFMYLDRFYTPSTEGALSLKKQGYKLFDDIVFQKYSQYARGAILNAINHERNQKEQDRKLLKDSVNVFVDLGYNIGENTAVRLRYYEQQLQQDIVKDAGNFYRREATTWLREDSTSAYLIKCEEALDAETDRVRAYLHRSTLEPLVKKCYTELLKVHQSALLNKTTGLYYLLEEKQNEDLKRVHDLYSRYPQDLPPIGEMFRTQVQKEGKAIVKRTNEAKGKSQSDEKHVLVTDLITLHRHYDTVVRDCFGHHQVFQKALKTAFESFINENDSVSKLLALYAHDVLKKGSKVTVENVEKTLDHVVFLYGYIRDKDVFDHDYQQLLQERLLKRKCSSEANERAMIAKLKSEAGYQWTNKLEGMFKDVGVSKNLTGLFKNFFNTEEKCGLTFNVNVCTHGFWPSTNYTSSKTPDALKMATDNFKDFYHRRYAEREIQWRMDMGEAEVLVRFNTKTEVRLSVSSYQMAFLLVFNKKKIASFQDILDATGLKSDTTLQNHLLSLAHPKLGVLLKRPNSRTLDRKHKFQLNSNFKCKMRRITVPIINVIRHSVNPTVDPSIAIQRRCQMDAAIVRAMKTKKRMQHMELVNEVTAQLRARFSAQPGMIKKRIEHLIEQEYLERDSSARGVYKYLA